MSRPHEELREALGAYALGQLDDELRREVDEHLSTCGGCRRALAEIAPVAEALRGLEIDQLPPVGTTPPAELDERIRRAIPGPPRNARPWAPVTIAVAAAAAAAAVVTAVVVRDDPAPGPTVIAIPRVDVAQGVTASAGLVDHTWGLEIKLEATGLRAGERFEVWVVGKDGVSHDAGEFVGVASTKIVCDMSSSILLGDAASFRVVDAAGDQVIAGAIPS